MSPVIVLIRARHVISPIYFHRLNQDGLVIEDEMSLDAGIVSASFDASLEMVRDIQFQSNSLPRIED